MTIESAFMTLIYSDFNKYSTLSNNLRYEFSYILIKVNLYLVNAVTINSFYHMMGYDHSFFFEYTLF